MAKRVAVSTLNASTIDILNVIRQNASAEYQDMVPEVAVEKDIPRVGEVLYGYPALANQFINALVNRIALVRVRSAMFNNDYAELKKGYLEFGETVENVFVNIVKAHEFSAEKAEARELKRSMPDVRSVFHAMNWRVYYPVTIQNDDLRTAFLSMSGVQDMIARIVDAVYTSANYDEFLLFKYLIIKAVSHGKMKPVSFTANDITDAAVKFRGISNQLTFMSKDYNEAGVTTTTPKADQYIFMDSMFNASFDVEVLAGAFNMDKADFMGRLKLIDDFTTFDNDRFSNITDASDMVEPVTAAELALMADVKAVLVDREWFQVYDNNIQFTEKYVASGLYWNYFLHNWKTFSHSPFANAVAFVTSAATITPPTTVDLTVSDKSFDSGTGATVFTLLDGTQVNLAASGYQLEQNEDATKKGIAIHPYGAVIFPQNAGPVTLSLKVPGTTVTYTATATLAAASAAGKTITFKPSTGG